MGHDLCRAHAHCAISFSREPGQAPYTIWFPEACMLCYGLSALLLSEEADDESLREARATLRPWVSGFGRNAPAGAPYLLDGDMASRLFPGSTTAAVPPETAAPLIEVIRETILTEEEVLVTEAEPYLGLDEEPMDELWLCRKKEELNWYFSVDVKYGLIERQQMNLMRFTEEHSNWFFHSGESSSLLSPQYDCGVTAKSFLPFFFYTLGNLNATSVSILLSIAYIYGTPDGSKTKRGSKAWDNRDENSVVD
ncbi:uncharacterized protein [Palaemon carinicauda]|uniref:uncharacterized protein n=1 Tax=Palaemon carinicauda TaxID=392227 RepID=UPI0035B65EA4